MRADGRARVQRRTGAFAPEVKEWGDSGDIDTAGRPVRAATGARCPSRQAGAAHPRPEG